MPELMRPDGSVYEGPVKGNEVARRRFRWARNPELKARHDARMLAYNRARGVKEAKLGRDLLTKDGRWYRASSNDPEWNENDYKRARAAVGKKTGFCYHKRKIEEDPTHKERVRVRLLNSTRKRLYGIGNTEVAEMLANQDGQCMLCMRDLPMDKARVDHCHDTGRVRGILCNKCNTALGLFNDDPELLRVGVWYLTRPGDTDLQNNVTSVVTP